MVHSHSVGEEPLGEYRYTVTRGSDALRITGTNLHLVRVSGGMGGKGVMIDGDEEDRMKG